VTTPEHAVQAAPAAAVPQPERSPSSGGTNTDAGGTTPERDRSTAPAPLAEAATAAVGGSTQAPRPSAAAHAEAPAARSAAEADVPQQIVRAIRTQFRDGIGEASIRLRPDHLGEVRIELKVEGERVTATLHVERPEVKQAIESQSGVLRAGLAAQGLRLEELSVNGTASTRDNRDSSNADRRDGSGGQRETSSGSDRRQRRRREEREFELDA
jgi:flagellar hook-length control protein FliK